MTFSAVLLAGGESRRMGRDKATLEFQGHPLWQNQLVILRDLDPAGIFVSSRTKPDWLPSGTELVADAHPSRGPLSGLTAALNRIDTTHLVALAVDMPFMTSAEMQVLLGLVSEGRGVVPVINDRFEPFAAIYPRDATPDFAAALARNELALQPLIKRLINLGRLRAFAVPAARRNLYRSVNDPGDLPT